MAETHVTKEYIEITLSINLILPHVSFSGSKELISEYLNHKLHTDPEFFGDFGPENITNIRSLEL